MAPGAVLVALVVSCGPQVELDASTGAASSTGAIDATAGPITVSTTTVTSSITTTSVDADDAGSSTGAVFPEHCSTIEQDCPPGYKCMPWANDGGGAWNDTKCVPIVEDPNTPGEPCAVVGGAMSGEDDCDGTSMCWDVDPETNMGVCQPFCIGTDEEPTCARPCDVCPQGGDATITLCFETCDPVLQGCEPGRACYPVNSSFVCELDASPEGTGIGSPCDFINVCPPGTACLDGASVPGCEGMPGCCASYCPVGAGDPCPGILPGTSCVPWFDEGEGPPMECLSVPPGVCIQ